ncbi:predicted protein [Postia placenta Mad-698-R]|nr:predicted protein [Postia placenta Mad-698-R]
MFFHRIGGGAGASVSPYREGTLGMTLPVTRGTEDCPRVKTAVVTVCRVNFERSECSSSLAAVTAVEVTEEVRRRGDAAVVAFRWPNFERSECSSGLSAESAVKAPKEVRRGGYAQALAQGLEGDLLELDWTRRQFGEGGSLRAVWDVDVDEVLRVECVNLALAGSHVGWGGGRGVKGRLCTLVRAQLVCAQHADAAPGAVDNDVSVSGR